MSAAEKQLKLKSNILRRCIKELEMYKEEVVTGESELSAIGKEHDKFKQLSEALEESKSMILNTTSRLRKAKEDVETLFTNTEDLDDNSDLKIEAKSYIDQAFKLID